MDVDKKAPPTQNGSGDANGKVPEDEPMEAQSSEGNINGQNKKLRKEKNKDKFRYGNYNQYYGKRLDAKFQRDPRLALFKEEWFKGRSVLDVGCNAGVISILIAKELGPRRVLGIDIDKELVGAARKNIRHYCDPGTKFAGKLPEAEKPSEDGAVQSIPKFPNNIWFIQGNYVLESDELLEMVPAEYNIILALSITKWVHLNWGDAGLKRFFHRCYKNLMPNGKLILETQDIKTYGKRARKGCDEMKEHYKAIKFLPDQFNEFLLNDVGFREAIELGTPEGTSKGFTRPIIMYVK